MFEWFKNFLKRFLPPPVRAFNREIERILNAIWEQRAVSESRFTAMEARQKANETLVLELTSLVQEEQTQIQSVSTQLNALLQEEQKQIQSISTQLITLLQEDQKQIRKLTSQVDELKELYSSGNVQTAQLQTKIADISSTVAQIRTDERLSLVLKGQQNVENSQNLMSGLLQQTKQQIASVSGSAQEAVWADIFHDTVCQSEWLKDRTFYPGRWAIGYPFLYVLYRVLNETRPKHILELGLGQSTRMIGQYAAAFEDVQHAVVEHDPEWIDFFQNDFPLSDSSTIVRLDREMVPFKDAEAVRTFAKFKETFADQQFDFIMIDAPLGGDMKQYARIDVLGLLPNCLAENFVIMLDDYNRSGEIHTGEEIKRLLNENKIPYQAGVYRGDKAVLLLCSANLKFLASM